VITTDETTYKIIGLCMNLHRDLGPGFPEKVYQRGLEIFLEKSGLLYEREKEFDVIYDNENIGQFRVDFFIENIIVELKSIEYFTKTCESQVVSYLKASGINKGLLINFGEKSLRVKRFIR
jgi:GxxExxY protein